MEVEARNSEVWRGFRSDFEVDRPIHLYGEFVEVPRLFSVESSDDETWVFDARRRSAEDRYPDDFDVRRTQRPPRQLGRQSLAEISDGGLADFRIPIDAFTFDPTRRRTLRLRADFDASALRFAR